MNFDPEKFFKRGFTALNLPDFRMKGGKESFRDHDPYDWRDFDSMLNECRKDVVAYPGEGNDYPYYGIHRRLLYSKYYIVDDIYIKQRNADPCPILPGYFRVDCDYHAMAFKFPNPNWERDYKRECIYAMNNGLPIPEVKANAPFKTILKHPFCDLDIYFGNRKKVWNAFVNALYILFCFGVVVVSSNLEWLYTITILFLLSPIFYLVMRNIPVWGIFFTPKGYRRIRAYVRWERWRKRENKRRSGLARRNAAKFNLPEPKWWRFERWYNLY